MLFGGQLWKQCNWCHLVANFATNASGAKFLAGEITQVKRVTTLGPLCLWQCFSMVPNHWSNNAMVTIHRSGLVSTYRIIRYYSNGSTTPCGSLWKSVVLLILVRGEIRPKCWPVIHKAWSVEGLKIFHNEKISSNACWALLRFFGKFYSLK